MTGAQALRDTPDRGPQGPTEFDPAGGQVLTAEVYFSSSIEYRVKKNEYRVKKPEYRVKQESSAKLTNQRVS